MPSTLEHEYKIVRTLANSVHLRPKRSQVNRVICSFQVEMATFGSATTASMCNCGLVCEMLVFKYCWVPYLHHNALPSPTGICSCIQHQN